MLVRGCRYHRCGKQATRGALCAEHDAHFKKKDKNKNKSTLGKKKANPYTLRPGELAAVNRLAREIKNANSTSAKTDRLIET